MSAQPLCQMCWDLEHPGRWPIRVGPTTVEICCRCNLPTTAGIWVRSGSLAPDSLPQPQQRKEMRDE